MSTSPFETSPDTFRPPFEPNAGVVSPTARSQRTGKPKFTSKARYSIRYARALQSRRPWLTVSQVLWVVLGGWLLFIGYALAGLVMILTLVLAPFGIQAMRFAWFALLPIGKEPFTPTLSQREGSFFTRVVNNPTHPLTVVANVVWLLIAGWAIALTHVVLAGIQFLTVAGIGNGVQHLRLALFALWPFGKQIRIARAPQWPAQEGVFPPSPGMGGGPLADGGGLQGGVAGGAPSIAPSYNTMSAVPSYDASAIPVNFLQEVSGSPPLRTAPPSTIYARPRPAFNLS